MMDATPVPTITIIDDSRDFQVQLTRQIRSWHPRSNVLTAGDVGGALKCISERRPDLLLLDLRLGGEDGIEILKRFPKEKRGFPILVVTGDAREGTCESAFRHGADDYVIKPIDEIILRSKVESLLLGRYFSPLNFFGKNGQGLAPIQMGFSIALHFISEEKIEFLSPVMFAKGAVVKVRITDCKLTAKVRRCNRSTNSEKGFFISAAVEEDEDRAARRRLILKILSAVKGPALASLMSALNKGRTELMDKKNGEPSEDPVIDPNALANLRSLNVEGEPDFASELIKIFFEYAPGYIQAMKDAASKNDAKAMGASAHCLRSSCANLGAYRMRDVCAKLEALGLAESLDGAAGLLEKLEADFKKVVQELARAFK